VRSSARLSVLVGRDHLAAVARREGLVDAVGLAVEIVDPGATPTAGRDRPWVPRVDRILDEPDRTVAEGEVASAGMQAGRRVGEVALTRHDLDLRRGI